MWMTAGIPSFSLPQLITKSQILYYYKQYKLTEKKNCIIIYSELISICILEGFLWITML